MNNKIILDTLRLSINDGFDCGGKITMTSHEIATLLDILDEYEDLKRVIGNIGCLLVEGEVDYSIKQICELEGYSVEYFKMINAMNSIY